ncbi:MAG: hypothetical protein K0B02_01295 [DPANN group archaeon]|nr:hypothetical protein [DPANN group archaeon]
MQHPSKKIRIKDILQNKCEKDNNNIDFIKHITGESVYRVRVLGTLINKYISNDGRYATITIDDGSETIQCKLFSDLDKIKNINKGYIIEVIGKIKKWNDEVYIQPEIIVEVKNPNLETLRKLEIAKSINPYLNNVEIIENKSSKNIIHEKNAKENIENTIKTESKPKRETEEKQIKIIKTQKKDNNQTKTLINCENENFEAIKDEIETKNITPRMKIIEIINTEDSGNGADYDTVIEKSRLTEKEAEKIIEALLEDGTCYEPRAGNLRVL